ncbi:hypothetical protein FQN50_003431 [Emmonsiellopsis sp. PD_5]|nr:hypothetical protein FQN50_003431 [Emmonsiellopsis sp. PD_5]
MAYKLHRSIRGPSGILSPLDPGSESALRIYERPTKLPDIVSWIVDRDREIFDVPRGQKIKFWGSLGFTLKPLLSASHSDTKESRGPYLRRTKMGAKSSYQLTSYQAVCHISLSKTDPNFYSMIA